MKKVSLLAVLIGSVADIISSFAIGVALSIGAVVLAALSHPRISAKVALHSPILVAAEILFGMLCSVFGGFVAAWIAKHDELLHGCLSSVLCVALGIVGISLGWGNEPLWQQILLVAASPILGLLGGYLRSRIRRRRNSIL